MGHGWNIILPLVVTGARKCGSRALDSATRCSHELQHHQSLLNICRGASTTATSSHSHGFATLTDAGEPAPAAEAPGVPLGHSQTPWGDAQAQESPEAPNGWAGDSRLSAMWVAAMESEPRSAVLEHLSMTVTGVPPCQKANEASMPESETKRVTKNEPEREVISGTSAADTVQMRQLLRTALVGAPNAGKSTLTNALVGTKVSAVSPKTNTTVEMRLGAFRRGGVQVVLYDTPGVVGPQSLHGARHEQRVRSAWSIAANADLLIFLVDAHRQITAPDDRVVKVIRSLGDGRPSGSGSDWNSPPAILVLNKVDLLFGSDRDQLLRLAGFLKQLAPFEEVFPISAARGKGINDLRDYLIGRAKPAEWILEEGATDQSDAEIAIEMVREQFFRRLHQELPYGIVPEHVSQKTLRDNSIRIEQVIYVPNETVRAMVLGKNGEVIGKIGIVARTELERYLNKRVHLILNVKVSRKK